MKEHIRFEREARIERITDPERALKAFLDFLERMKAAYPNKAYPNPRTNEYTYRKKGSARPGFRTYVAYSGADEAGVLAGEENENGLFMGKQIIIDPKTATRSTMKSLLDALKRDFSEIRLRAIASGESIDASEEKMIGRQGALLRTYERLGFLPVSYEQYQEAQQTGAEVDMYWKKDDMERTNGI